MSVTVDLFLSDGSNLTQRELLGIDSGMLLVKGKYGNQQIPLTDVRQIVMAGGSQGRKGVQLRFGQIGATVKEMKNGRWFFELQDEAGTLAVMDASQVLSVNVTEPRINSENLDVRSINVLQWISDHKPFGKEGNWDMDVREVNIAENMIVVSADVWSDDQGILNSRGCFLACRIQDNQGRISELVWTEIFKVPPKVDTYRLQIRCPVPPPAPAPLRFSYVPAMTAITRAAGKIGVRAISGGRSPP